MPFCVRFRTARPLLWALSLVIASSPRAATIDLFPGSSFESAVESLNPGDTLIVHAGTYSGSGRISIAVHGTAAAPVLVRGATGEARPLITRPVGATAQNTINIEGASYLTLQGLEIRSQPGGDGVNLNSNPSYITLEDLDIHDIDVGVNFRSSMHHITVRRNQIYRTGGSGGGTGEGMYVGCNYAECAVSESLIEGNWIHDTTNSTQGDGIEIKRGSHSNIIRDNVIYNTQYPCILLYGSEGNPRNVVEGNVMWNCADTGIQAAADAIIRNNIIFNTSGGGFTSQDHQEVTPNRLEFVHNTVVGGSPCLRLSNWSGKQGMVLANNAIYCGSNNFVVSGLTGVTVTGNVVIPSTSSLPTSGYVLGRSTALDFIDSASRNVYPSSDSKLKDAGNPSWVTALDFNGTSRTGTPDAGAYTWTTTQNSGWAVGPGFKNTTAPPLTPPPPPLNLRVQ